MMRATEERNGVSDIAPFQKEQVAYFSIPHLSSSNYFYYWK
jgi:hypothetical protein